MPQELTEQDGRRALRDHIIDKASAARDKYGPRIDWAAMLRMLDDRSVVRFPTRVRFDAGPLQTGEFAHAEQIGESPAGGYCVYVHPFFEDRTDVLPLLVSYHLVSVNYGEIATHREAELFGATLLDLEVEEYYRTLCDLADAVPARSARKSIPTASTPPADRLRRP